ncbi:MAG TPA: hypothetical protein VL282_06520 [Tepidisphaeraceae bacterium]|jgi:hypothetical protein|nr:hypothetical protein [Tepidisphaeraceae bacterium]
MQHRSATGRLFLQKKDVGEVRSRGQADSWYFGDFEPNPAFSEFATLFGSWSLLMHAEEDEERQSDAASDELRRAEAAIDALRARIYFPDEDRWVDIVQLNIDGKMIEWKALEKRPGS